MSKPNRKITPEKEVKIQQALSYFRDVVKEHPEIEKSVWATVHWNCLVAGAIECGVSYEAFCSEINNAVEFAIKHWKDLEATQNLRESLTEIRRDDYD